MSFGRAATGLILNSSRGWFWLGRPDHQTASPVSPFPPHHPPPPRGVNLLLETEAGRQLLQQSGLLAAALPELQRRSAAATEAALNALQLAPAAGRKGGAPAAGPSAANDPALAACCDAVDAACFCARVSMHLAGLAALAGMVDGADGKVDDDEGLAEQRRAASAAACAAAAAGLAQSVLDAGSTLASAADWLAARRGDDDDGGVGGARKLWGAPRRLAGGAGAMLGLLGDALRMGLVECGPAETERAAGCGRSALGLLAALRPCAMEGPAEEVLRGDSALLRLLLAPAERADGAAAAGSGGAAAAGEQLQAWVEEWLRALASGPLADCAASVRAHVPAVLGGLLLPEAAGRGQQWLAPLAEAAGAAVAERSEGAEEDGENADPNRRAGGKARGGKAGEGEGGKAAGVSVEELPAVVGYFVQAARLKKVGGGGRGGGWGPTVVLAGVP